MKKISTTTKERTMMTTTKKTLPKFVQISTAYDNTNQPKILALDASGRVWRYVWGSTSHPKQCWQALSEARHDG